jgi:hypothetical protein
MMTHLTYFRNAMPTFYLILPITFLLHSCFIADEFFLPPEKPAEEKINLQAQTEREIRKAILSDTLNKNYVIYDFSPIKIIVPYLIDSLERLQSISPKTGKDSINIKQLKQYIRDNNIRKTIKTTHFFTLDYTDSTTAIIESEYTLNDTLSIIKSIPKTFAVTSNSLIKNLPNYFYERTIFQSGSYEDSRKLSIAFYTFFKDRFDQLSGIEERGLFLQHALRMTKMVSELGEFNQTAMLEKLTSDYIVREKKEIKDYKSLGFSNLYETLNEEDSTLLGYYFFHNFIGTFNDQADTNVVLVEFNPFYQIEHIFQMDQSFDTYLKP